jgi:hypothetical protein
MKRTSSGSADAHAAAHHVFLPAERALEIRPLVQHRFGAGAHRAAERAQLQPLAHAVEQLHVELPLQIGERAAHG